MIRKIPTITVFGKEIPMRRLLALAALLFTATSTAFAGASPASVQHPPDSDRDIVIQGLVGGPMIGIEILPAFTSIEYPVRFQAKRPAVITAYAFNDDVTIEVYRLVGKGRNQRWQLLVSDTHAFPVVSFIPAKTAPYLIVVYNPNAFPIVFIGRTN